MKAKLIALKTSDGLVEVKNNVEVGREYDIDLSTVHTITLFNLVHRVRHQKEVVMVRDGDEWNWMPTELLAVTAD